MVSTRSSSGLTPRPPKAFDAFDDTLPARTRRSVAGRKSSRSATASPPPPPSGWSHTPTAVSLAWLAVSLPLVFWDMGYVFLRPHSMPGGSLHWPLWVPYELYGNIDHIYGFKAWNANVGFTAAQTALNLVETVMYLVYVALWYRYGVNAEAGKTVAGRTGGLTVAVGFAAAVMTVSKTVLYWLNEYFSGFDNIGHNSLVNLVVLWIIPNGLWLIFPTYMIYSIGSEIVDGLALASDPAIKTE